MFQGSCSSGSNSVEPWARKAVIISSNCILFTRQPVQQERQELLLRHPGFLARVVPERFHCIDAW